MASTSGSLTPGVLHCLQDFKRHAKQHVFLELAMYGHGMVRQDGQDPMLSSRLRQSERRWTKTCQHGIACRCLTKLASTIRQPGIGAVSLRALHPIPFICPVAPNNDNHSSPCTCLFVLNLCVSSLRWLMLCRHGEL